MGELRRQLPVIYSRYAEESVNDIHNLAMQDEEHKSSLGVLVIDDERPARLLLRSLIERDSSLVVVGESSGGQSAVNSIKTLQPDIVFLDVEMPELDGITVARRVADVGTVPYFIFVTAHDRFAVEAFELGAVDFLVKPVSRKRLASAISRAKLAHQRDSAVRLSNRVLDYLNSARSGEPAAPGKGFLTLRKQDVLQNVSFGNIVWAEAANQYVRIHTTDDSYMMSESLGRFASRLNDPRFLRIHRSAVINGEHIERIQSRGKGVYSVRLQTGEELTLARSRLSLLPKLLSMASGS